MQEQIHLAESFIANADTWKGKGRHDLAQKSLEGAAEIYEELAGITDDEALHQRRRTAWLLLEEHHLAHGRKDQAALVKKRALTRVTRKPEPQAPRVAGKKHDPSELDCTCSLGEEDPNCPEHQRIKAIPHEP